VTTVLCEVAQAIPAIAARFPEVEVIDLSETLPDGVTGDVLYGGYGPVGLEAVRRGVEWVQLPYTGIDACPAEILAVPRVTAAKGAGAVPISEYVLATMLAFGRGFPGHWLTEAPARWNFQRTSALAGSTLGLVGLGGIGERVARLALAFDMEVLAVRRTPRPSGVPGVEVVAELDDLVASVDHLVLCAPSTERTHHLVDDRLLGLVKPGLHLVNIARGALIDHDALRSALDDGRVARASLDVCDPEPLPAGHWLYDHPSVYLTPHSSWTGTPMLGAATELFLDNLDRFLRGEALVGLVDPAEGY
jgi:phosphoglycerate dehydrogenase-like enzyme